MVFAKGEIHAAHVRHLRRVLQGPIVTGKQLRHLRFAAKVEIPGFVAHPVLVVQDLSRLDAKEHVVGLRVLLSEVVGIVGADHGQPRLPVNAQNAPVHHRLVLDAVILKLQIKVVRAKNLRQLQGVTLGVLILPVPQPPGNLPRQAGGEGHQAPAVFPQQLQVNPGLDIKTLGPGQGDHIGEVPVALLVLAEEHQMAALGVELMDLVGQAAALCRDVDLAADDGLNPLRLAGPVEIHRAVHDPVVRDGTGGLPHFFYDFRQVPDTARAVQKAVLRMNMQMNKGHGPSPFSIACLIVLPVLPGGPAGT